jgi:putative addiction module component (TIGR02574 family)
MAPVLELLEAQVLGLPPQDRSRLVDLLLVSLQELPQAEIEAAWDSEVERRLAAYDRGEVQAIDGEEVMAKARALARR